MKEMQECTFKPKLNKSENRSRNEDYKCQNVKGFYSHFRRLRSTRKYNI